MTPLKSIEEEATDCRARCAGSPIGTRFHLLHHGVHFEFLTAPAEERIQVILTEKPEWQRAARLRHMGPWTGPVPATVREAWDRCIEAMDRHIQRWVRYRETEARDREAFWDHYSEARDCFNKARAAWEATPEFAEQHAKLFPDCPWDGETMFPGVQHG